MGTYPKQILISSPPSLTAVAVEYANESNRNSLVTRLLPLGMRITGRHGLERHRVEGGRRSPSRIFVKEVPERK